MCRSYPALINRLRFHKLAPVLAPAGGMNMPAPLREAGQERASEPSDRAPICIVAAIQERTSPIVHRRPGARRRSRPLIGVLRHGSDCDLLGDFESTIDSMPRWRTVLLISNGRHNRHDVLWF
jgi:hypothetical protein